MNEAPVSATADKIAKNKPPMSAKAATSAKNEAPVSAVDVVAALIVRGERILVCRRPAHKARGLLWEFAGGKVERGETKEEALRRECREELGIVLAVGDVYAQVVHAYPDLTVRLTLFRAEIAEGEPQAFEHCELRWATREELFFLPFCPADKPILERIRKEGL